MISANATCFPFNSGHDLKVKKNYEPFVLGPRLAIDTIPLFE